MVERIDLTLYSVIYPKSDFLILQRSPKHLVKRKLLFMRQFPKFLLTLSVWAALATVPQSVLSHEWRPVRGGIQFGISGLALLPQQSEIKSFVIVHDNKEKNQGRLAIITIPNAEPPQYLPLNWPSDTPLPIDLESLTTVPGTPEPTFMAATSLGKVYHFRLDDSQQNISILKVFDLPNIPPGSNLEGFAVQTIENQLVAVWAHRGENQQPAILYWGQLNLNTNQIIPQGSTQLRVPFPVKGVRHISDLKVDPAGVLFISSAADTGNDGPFDSAVYVAGALKIRGQQIAYQQNYQIVPLYRFKYHKIEAIELVPGANGGLIVGSDDENMGGSVYFNF